MTNIFKYFQALGFRSYNFAFYAFSNCLLYVYVLSFGLSKGGRWDLYQQIFTGIRLSSLDFSSAYLSGHSSFFHVLTVYPLFQPFILGLLSKILTPVNIEYFSIFFIAPTIACIFFSILTYIGMRLSDFNQRFYYPIILVNITLFILSGNYIYYLSELKPDTLALVLLLLLILLLNKNSNPSPFSLICSVLLCFLTVLTKQQLVLPLLFLLLFNLFRHKYLNFIALFVSLMFSLIPYFIIDDYYYVTVLSHAGRGYSNVLLTFYESARSTFFLLAIPFTLLFFSIPITYKNILSPFYIINTLRCNFYFLKSPGNDLLYSLLGSLFCFYFSQLLSTFNFGGNQGNYQVGLLPMISITFPLFLKYINSILPSTSFSYKLFSCIIISFLILLISINHFKNFPLKANNLSHMLATSDAFVQENLVLRSENYILVDGNTSLLASSIQHKKLIDLHHILHLSLSNDRVKHIDDFNLLLSNLAHEQKVPFILSRTPDQLSSLSPKYSFLSHMHVIQSTCDKLSDTCVGYIGKQ